MSAQLALSLLFAFLLVAGLVVVFISVRDKLTKKSTVVLDQRGEAGTQPDTLSATEKE